MKVRFTAEAQKQARYERARWRAYRDTKGLFDEELSAATGSLEAAPKLAVYCVLAGESVRRLFLKKTRVHVYFVIDDAQQIVRVVAVWGARRGAEPF